MSSPDASALSPDVLRALRDHFGDALDLLRETEPCKSLEAGPWAVFIAFANALRRTGAGSRVEQLAEASGCSRATTFRHAATLKEHQILRPLVGASGRYGVGPRLDAWLETFARSRETPPDGGLFGERPASLRAVLQSFPSASLTVRLPSSQSETAPALSLLREKDLNSSSLNQETRIQSSRARERAREESQTRAMVLAPRDAPDTLVRPTEPPRRRFDLRALRAAAVRALTFRHKRNWPEHPLPPMFGAADVDVIVRASQDGLWTEAELDQLHMDAVVGAEARAKKKPPSVRFIWAEQDYFLGNAAAGRAEREAKRPKVKKRKPPEEPAVSLTETAVHAANVVDILDRIPEDPRSKRDLGARFRGFE